MRRWVCPCILLLGILAPHGQAQDRPVGQVLILGADERIAVDGRLDEDAWARAPVIREFTQVDPVEGAPPSEQTEVRVLADRDNIYIGLRCLGEPARIIAREMRRDANLGNDDHATVVIDTFGDRRNGFVFIVSPAGGKRDGIVTDGRAEFDWDGIWYVRSRISDEGWVSEIRIPAKTLSFDPSRSRWGLNVQRVIRDRNEIVRWASPSRNSGILEVGDAGDLEGVVGLRQGIGLDIQPFAALRSDFVDGDSLFEPGVDLFYKITPSITGSLTINTDFAETEVDDRQVNLTRFPLFFPEKRDFFLQDAGTFRFGGIRRSPLPFFSRRIGIVRGEEKEIAAGLKVTGRTGNLQFGVLDVQMKHDPELGDKNLMVARARVDVLEQSSLGFIVTNGNPGDRGQNTLVGMDFGYRSTTLVDGGVVDGDLWFQATSDRPADEERVEDYALGGRLGIDKDPWDAGIFFAQLGHDYRPRLGFARRPGEREMSANAAYRWRPGGGTGFLRSVRFQTRYSMFTDLDGEINTIQWTAPTIEFNSADGDFVRFNMEVTRERLVDPFEISEGVTIPVGEYDNIGVSMNASTTQARWISASGFFSYEGFFSGIRRDWGGGFQIRPGPSLVVGANYSQNDIDLREGSFSVRIASARVRVDFSPQLSWSTLVQWDNQSDEAGLNTRLRYELQPGNEMFIVYNLGLDTEEAYRTTTSEATIKVGWTFRF